MSYEFYKFENDSNEWISNDIDDYEECNSEEEDVELELQRGR